jgi:hypothetical protein
LNLEEVREHGRAESESRKENQEVETIIYLNGMMFVLYPQDFKNTPVLPQSHPRHREKCSGC